MTLDEIKNQKRVILEEIKQDDLKRERVRNYKSSLSANARL
jgi:hypothetical protein